MNKTLFFSLIIATFSIPVFAQNDSLRPVNSDIYKKFTAKDFQCPPQFPNSIGRGGLVVASDSGDNFAGSDNHHSPDNINTNSETLNKTDVKKIDLLKTNLKILSKPIATYTDNARKKCVEGDVYLRVQFLKNGKIGKVSVVRGLPLGLTKSALKVAKKMRFEPARKDGAPISVTKQVKYNFTLY